VVGGGGATAQAPSAARHKGARRLASTPRDNRGMWLILLEALGAGLILVGIVWWTMFSGRRGGERPGDDDDPSR